MNLMRWGWERISRAMKRRARTKYVLPLILCMQLFFSTACFQTEFEYTGDFPELFSVALHSMLGVRGFRPEGFLLAGPRIEVLEKDDYERILFSYFEDSIGFASGLNYLIVQKADGEYAYFYPYNSFVSAHLPGVMDEFKEANSWNQELSDDSEFERVRITRKIEDGPIADKHLIDVYHEIYPGVPLNRREHALNFITFLRADDYGKSVYFTSGISPDWTGRYAIFFQADHSFDIESGVLKIEYQYNYQTELRLFMEANGWNTPP